MFGNIGEILGKAQQMRGEMKAIQDNLVHRTVEVATSGGMVKVVANGKMEILSVIIAPELLAKNDATLLQELVRTGVNQAIQASQALVAEEMGKLTAGLGPLGALLKGFGN